MNLILSHEKVVVNGKSVSKIYGGFGNNQPCLLAKQIADLHGYKLKEINQLLNNNLDWFDEGLDFIDIKSVVIPNDHEIKKCLLNFYSQEGLNRSNSIYVFSQQGYAMLCKLLKSDLAKKIYKQMVREYFRMVENELNEEYLRENWSQSKESALEKYWFSGKLAEIIVNELKQNREELNQNRKELNQIHLEVRSQGEELKNQREDIATLKEQMRAIEKRLGKNKNIAENKETEQSREKTKTLISKQQGAILQKTVKNKAKSLQHTKHIWAEFKKRFEISRYLHLPEARFKEALEWLEANENSF